MENYLYEKVLLEGFIDAYAVAANDPLDELCEDKDNPDEHCTIGVTDLGDSIRHGSTIYLPRIFVR